MNTWAKAMKVVPKMGLGRSKGCCCPLADAVVSDIMSTFPDVSQMSRKCCTFSIDCAHSNTGSNKEIVVLI